MRHAVLADIHGNLEALEAAIDYFDSHELKKIICLGDSIGYGANPNECLEWVLKNSEFHVLGNHEAAIVHEKIRGRFNDWARIAIDWTAENLNPGLTAKLKELSYMQIVSPMTLAHGTIHRPEDFEYLMDDVAIQNSFRALTTRVGLVGHSHVPCWFAEKRPEAGGHLIEGKIQLEAGERYLLNPGSIGQPRDRDPRLSFGIFDDKELTFEIVRLSYNNKKAAEKIRAEGLPRILADRLL